MKTLKIALMQLLPLNSIEENMKKGAEYCKKAKDMGADIALFPEMWSVGYTIPEDIKELKSLAVSDNGEFIKVFSKTAAELNMAVGITFLEKNEPLPKNTFCLIDRHGKTVLKYSKVHTCDFGDEKRLCPGDDFYVGELDTENGMVKTGAMICFDREFPESARILMLKGAEIILTPNSCPMEINRICQLRARAYENMVGIATANYPLGKDGCNGHSTAFDCIAYRPGGSCSRDTLIIEAGEREGIYIADFPVDEIREYRGQEVHGNAYRRPEKYKILSDCEINEPFLRGDRRK